MVSWAPGESLQNDFIRRTKTICGVARGAQGTRPNSRGFRRPHLWTDGPGGPRHQSKGGGLRPPPLWTGFLVPLVATAKRFHTSTETLYFGLSLGPKDTVQMVGGASPPASMDGRPRGPKEPAQWCGASHTASMVGFLGLFGNQCETITSVESDTTLWTTPGAQGAPPQGGPPSPWADGPGGPRIPPSKWGLRPPLLWTGFLGPGISLQNYFRR
jgi:hypothetical protein